MRHGVQTGSNFFWNLSRGRRLTGVLLGSFSGRLAVRRDGAAAGESGGPA